MGKAQETSLLFSLESLMREERGRVEREREEALALERARERQRAREAERLARQREEAARLRERELAERARMEREEQARLAAIREAEIERVRLEVEARSAEELRTREFAHQVELERTRAVTRTNVRRLALATSVLLGLGSVLGAGVLLFGSQRDGGAQPGFSFADELSQERQRLARLEHDLKEERDRLENQQHEREQQPPSAPSAETPTAPSPQRDVRRGPAPARPPRVNGVENKRPCRGDPNDPLNPCLNP